MQFELESIRRPFSSFSRRKLLVVGGAVAAAVIGAGVFYNAHGSSSYTGQAGQNNQRTTVQRQVSGNPFQQAIVHTQQQAQQAQQQAQQQGVAACTSGDSPQSRTISLGTHTFNICPPAVPAH